MEKNDIQNEVRDCQKIQEWIDDNKRILWRLKSNINQPRTAISDIKGGIFGIGPVGVDSLKKGLIELDKNYTETFGYVSQAVSVLNDQVSASLDIIKASLLVQMQTINEILNNKRKNSESAKRIQELTDKVRSEQLSLEELINIQVEFSRIEEERFPQIESKLYKLSKRHNSFFDSSIYKIGIGIIALCSLVFSILL